MAHLIHFTLTIDNPHSVDPADPLKVMSFTLNEHLSDLFCLQAELVSPKSSSQINQIIDTQANFTIWHNKKAVRHINGIVQSFTHSDSSRAHYHYRITIVPALYRLSLRRNCRSFQHQTTQEIISLISKEMGIDEPTFNLEQSCKPRDYCVQYLESDLTFISRLAAEEGMGYRFQHSKTQHNTVFFDNNSTLDPIRETVYYKSLSGSDAQDLAIWTFSETENIRTTSVLLKDYSSFTPANPLQYRSNARSQGAAQYEHFDYPGGFCLDDVGKNKSRQRLEQLRSNVFEIGSTSNVPQLAAGKKFTLSEHPEKRFNKSWLVTSITHRGKQPQAMQEQATDQPTTYENAFTAISGNHPWRPEQITKPRIEGLQIALVTGPQGEEIFCDEHGRVKVKFPWDCHHTLNEKSSCWVRVSQGWAGAQFGMVTLPRVGNEVLVSFINGDPDQPIITGRTFNATHLFPYALPQNKTKTVMRSQSYKGKGYNELSFEDNAGKESVFLRAQKDALFTIQNDQDTQIGRNHNLMIKKDSLTEIKQDLHLTVRGESRTKVTKNKTLIVDGSLNIKSGAAFVNEAETEIHIKSGQKIIIDAGSELTLKVGGNFITIDASGVSIVGSNVNINSGGSAGSGSGFEGEEPKTPKKQESEKSQNTRL